MAKNDAIYLYVWSGDAQRARALAGSLYPGIEIREFPHRILRESSFKERLRLLRGFRGRAIVFCFESLDDFRYKQLFQCVHFVHRCRETVLCDDGGRGETIRTFDILRSAPRILFSLLRDLTTLGSWWCYLHLRLARAPSAPVAMGDGKLAYLIPSPVTMGTSGGAISQIRGFLYGEAAMLSYNLTFTRGVQTYLASASPGAFYQRHCRFSIAGALLSRRLKVPLILEYNGPEGWIADHWDPTPFRSWVRLCEEVSLRCATRIIVVSEALRAELTQRGIPADRIRVNPNAVDPEYFCPGRRRESGRRELGVEPDEVLVGFAGSFSLWHGIEVLEQTIVRLLGNQAPTRLRFVLMGNGLLHGAMRSALAAYEKTGDVIFTGSVPSNKVVEYLDASDILVSPHIPMPDGSRFFGSPTKIFEYMAMGKGIVASRLEQIAEVLEHERTALLVTPGDVDELAGAILDLAVNPEKRGALGD